MGWKLAGLAIKKNFSDRIPDLFNLLQANAFTLIEASTFEEQSVRIFEDNEIAVGFFGGGSLVFTGIEIITNDKVLKAASVASSILAFYINDTTGTYCLDYFENGEHVICNWASSGDPNINGSSNFGKIPLSCNGVDDLDTVFNFIGQQLGQRFYEIEEESPMLYYRKV